MAKDGERKINRTCTYVRADSRYVSAVIVALGAGSTVDLRVGHHSGDSSVDHSAVAEMSSPTQTNVWLPGSRYRY